MTQLLNNIEIRSEIKILLVGNALLSLLNPYAQVTKKRPILYWFSVSNLHSRPRKNNYPFDIYENMKS